MRDVGTEGAEGSESKPGSGTSLALAEAAPVLTVVIAQPEEPPGAKHGVSRSAAGEKDEKGGVPGSAKKGCLARSGSERQECRVCQQPMEEPLIDLGCSCRGDLAKAHRSCIEMWFHTRGSNRCEICRQVAANVPPPNSQPSMNYWVWRGDSAFGANRGERERGCCNPLLVAFAILIGGLLLDVLISVSLGVSTLPVNIIIGVLIVLGLGTGFRLALECCHGWGSRSIQRPDSTITPGYRPAV